MARKNQAVLYYKGKRFQIWQDDNSNWCYNLDELVNVPTSSKELQVALNMVYETIEEQNRPQGTRSKRIGKRSKDAAVHQGR
jgi:hypothetical protein